MPLAGNRAEAAKPEIDMTATPLDSADLTGRSPTTVLSLDPWTLYGELVAGQRVTSAQMTVPDIGVHPPPGRYLGTLIASKEMPARITISGRASNEPGPRWLIELEVIGDRLPTGDATVALRFEALELEDGDRSLQRERGRT